MKTFPRHVRLGRLIFLLLVFAAFFAGGCAKKDQDDPEDKNATAAVPQRVAEVNDETVVKLSDDEIKRSDVEAAVLPTVTQRVRRHALAVIMDLSPLFDSAAALADVQAQAAKAKAALAASGGEYDRLKKLQAQGQGVSVKDLQAAQAAAEADDAANRSAQTAWEVRRAALEHQWGPVLTGWMTENTAEFQQLTKGEIVLARVTAPERGDGSPPAAADLQRPDKQWAQARFVSASPQAAPEFQSESWFFSVDAGGGLLPGMNVEALIPAGRAARSGVVLPDAAVVWWQGGAWIFVQTAKGVFTQRAVSTDQPEPEGGYFVADFPAGQAVVVRGAQILLSEVNKPAPGGD